MYTSRTYKKISEYFELTNISFRKKLGKIEKGIDNIIIIIKKFVEQKGELLSDERFQEHLQEIEESKREINKNEEPDSKRLNHTEREILQEYLKIEDFMINDFDPELNK